MGRSLLIAEPIGGINGKSLLVGTAHLESSDNGEVRIKQLQHSIDILKNCQNNVMMGDFNFNSTWKD
jgi:endonuclease/exonuclease/phosphatase family metal-dependent hydrolase